jgi:hypothetical protein
LAGNFAGRDQRRPYLAAPRRELGWTNFPPACSFPGLTSVVDRSDGIYAESSRQRALLAHSYVPSNHMPTLLLDQPNTARRGTQRRKRIAAEPLRIAIAYNKGGVSKTTSTFVLGRHLSRTLRVEMVDLDRTRYLTEVVTQLSPRGDLTLSPRLWLRHGEPSPCDVVLMDSEPARDQYTREALLQADYVLIPVPPEPLCLKGLTLMLDVVEYVRKDHNGGNPFIQVMGVLPTLYDQRWPNHRAWMTEMAEECRPWPACLPAYPAAAVVHNTVDGWPGLHTCCRRDL